MLAVQVKICLGHYAFRGFSNPLNSRQGKKHQLVELTDYATIRMNRAKYVFLISYINDKYI